MSIAEWVKKELYSCGMFENQAEEVLERAKESDGLKGTMKGRWDENIDAYPFVVLNALWINIKSIALDYIKETCPMAWFRPMFEQ